MQFVLLLLLPLAQAGVDYLMMGHNYADVCCDIAYISAVHLTYTNAGAPDPDKFLLILDRFPVENLTVQTEQVHRPCPSSSNEACNIVGLQRRINLTTQAGFVRKERYEVIFETSNGDKYSTLFRPCDCNCTENAWVSVMYINFTRELNPDLMKNVLTLRYNCVSDVKTVLEDELLIMAMDETIYNSCQNHGWTNLENNLPDSICEDPKIMKRYDQNFPYMDKSIHSSPKGQVMNFSATISNVVFIMHAWMPAKTIPEPYKMDNYVVHIGTFMVPMNFNGTLQFTPSVKTVSNNVNVELIDYEDVDEVCSVIEEANYRFPSSSSCGAISSFAVIILCMFLEM